MTESNIQVGDTVKIIGKTLVGGVEKELIPVGTICRVMSILPDRDGRLCYGVKDERMNFQSDSGIWAYYDEKSLEKGAMIWIKSGV